MKKRLEHTPNNIKLKDIEQALTRVYLRIFREIKKEADYPNNITGLKLKYNKLIYDNTRSAVQQSVIIGIERINRQLKMQSYLTKKDIEVIETNTDKQVQSFWRKVELAIKEEESLLIGGSISDYFNSAAISAVFTSLADSVKSKVEQLKDVFREKPKLRWQTKGDSKVCEICRLS